MFIKINSLLSSSMNIFIEFIKAEAKAKAKENRTLALTSAYSDDYLIETTELITTGSHFLTHADWGCLDGEHVGRIIVDVESKEEARAIVPPAYRSQARIVQLNKFTLEEIDEILRHHEE
jgi:hypothetical protein